jgi:hypothetical protein
VSKHGPSSGIDEKGKEKHQSFFLLQRIYVNLKIKAYIERGNIRHAGNGDGEQAKPGHTNEREEVESTFEADKDMQNKKRQRNRLKRTGERSLKEDIPRSTTEPTRRTKTSP